MGKGAWRYDALDRNTKLIRDFCSKYKFDLKELTPYQFRIEELLDVYPVRQKWHWIQTNERGVFANTEELKKVILERLPEVDEDNPPLEPINQQRQEPKYIVLDGVKYELVEVKNGTTN